MISSSVSSPKCICGAHARFEQRSYQADNGKSLATTTRLHEPESEELWRTKNSSLGRTCRRNAEHLWKAAGDDRGPRTLIASVWKSVVLLLTASIHKQRSPFEVILRALSRGQSAHHVMRARRNHMLIRIRSVYHFVTLSKASRQASAAWNSTSRISLRKESFGKQRKSFRECLERHFCIGRDCKGSDVACALCDRKAKEAGHLPPQLDPSIS
jgi:hypothetical protein